MSSVLDLQKLAEDNFKNAVGALETALKEHKRWSMLAVSFPEIENLVCPEIGSELVAREVEKVLEKVQIAVKKPQSQSWLQKVKDILERFFRSSFHFTQVLLVIMKEASQVCSTAFTSDGSFHF